MGQYYTGANTDHYAVVQLREVCDSLELITKPSEEFESLGLHALIRKTQAQRFTQNLSGKENAASQEPCKAA